MDRFLNHKRLRIFWKSFAFKFRNKFAQGKVDEEQNLKSANQESRFLSSGLVQLAISNVTNFNIS